MLRSRNDAPAIRDHAALADAGAETSYPCPNLAPMTAQTVTETVEGPTTDDLTTEEVTRPAAAAWSSPRLTATTSNG